ncbi:MAG: CHASE4 domain-containing protein [Polyangiaceae bacterium]
MTLKTKTVLFVLSGLLLVMTAMTYGARSLVETRFDTIEREQTVGVSKDAMSVVDTIVDEFLFRGYDWSDWDDMATYLADGNKEFEEGNLTADGLASVNWDHLIVLRSDGKRVFSGRWDRKANTLVKASDDLEALINARILFPRDPKGTVAGFALLDGQLHMVTARPIYKTDHKPGEAQGFMITSRVVDKAWKDRVRKFTFLDLDLLPVSQAAPDDEATAARAVLNGGSGTYLTERGEDSLVTYTRVKDVAGAPLMDVRIVRPLQLNSAASTMLAMLTKGLGVAGILLALLAALGMTRGVLRPLGRVLDGVQALESGSRAEVDVKSSDEIGELASAFNRMASVIVEREESLRLVLDSTGDGLVVCDLQGTLADQASAPAVAWFGETQQGKLWQWLPLDENAALQVELVLEQVADDFLPFEVSADMLPKQFCHGERTFRITYRPIRKGDELTSLLVAIRDATDEVAAERAERDARELQAVARQAMRDRSALTSFLEESQTIIDSLDSESDIALVKRGLHTLKGNSGIFGLQSVSETCHQAEDEIAMDEENAPHAIASVKAAWQDAKQRIDSVFGGEGTSYVELEEGEYQRFLQRLIGRREAADIVREVRQWRHAPTQAVMDRLGAQVARVADRVGKSVDVVVEASEGRIPRDDLTPFFSSLVHVVRNAVDHGIEDALERVDAGKREQGRVRLIAVETPEEFRVEIQDDGRGIDWERVRLKAEAMGAAHQTRADLERALFSDGFSTKDEVTDLSGRGVGLGAVRAELEARGGLLSVESAPGRGTRFIFRFPLVQALAAE